MSHTVCTVHDNVWATQLSHLVNSISDDSTASSQLFIDVYDAVSFKGVVLTSVWTVMMIITLVMMTKVDHRLLA